MRKGPAVLAVIAGLASAGAAQAQPEQVDELVLLSDDVGALRDQLHAYAELGFEVIYLHSVGKDQRPFLDLAGEHLLPALAEATAAA